MSEFQYYEFVAIDRPLNATERKRLRAITSRATISSTRLVNTYEWGNFKADPHELVAKYFDAFLYYANWGTRRLILRVPSTRLDLKIAEQYCAIRTARSRSSRSIATVTATGKHVVIDLWSATGGHASPAKYRNRKEISGGERGIRTLEGLLTLTPLAGVSTRPSQSNRSLTFGCFI